MAEMVRLTKRRKDGSARLSCSNCPDNTTHGCNGLCEMHAVNRLAQIEDILGQVYDLEGLRNILEGNQPVKVPVFRGKDHE